MSEQCVHHQIHVNVDADPLAFLLGIYAGLALVLILLLMKDKKEAASITPIRRSDHKAEKEIVE